MTGAITAEAKTALARLAARARADLVDLAYPDRDWVVPAWGPGGMPAADVLVVGAGQSGLGIAAALRREGVHRVVVLEQAAAGAAGPWRGFARMSELRTPKALVGLELGLPSLSLRHWHAARYGSEAWHAIERLPRTDWADYLDWYRDTTGVEVEWDVPVAAIEPAGDLLAVATGAGATRYARAVVLATGFDGGGAWRPPDELCAGLPPSVYDHACGPIDFAGLRGKRVGVLGHGAAAFDNAIAALDAGAAAVGLCFRRARLPRTNPHRHIETAGLMTHYPALSDATRWRIARHFKLADQPPPVTAFNAAMARSNFQLLPGTPWRDVRYRGGVVHVDTPRGPMRFDHVIFGTGLQVDLAARPELRGLAGRVVLWRDRYAPPAAAVDSELGALPYLDDGYGFMPRNAADVWVRRVFAFNGASALSHGPHSTSISGHKHALHRLVRGVTRRLLLDQEAALVPALEAFEPLDLPVPDDFEAALAPPAERTLP